MILKQYYLGCLSHASYLVADEKSGAAAVVDPQRDVAQYLEEARAAALRIEHVFLTHFHADFLAGHLELQRATGARIYLGARAEAEYPFTPLKEGDTVSLGAVRLRILETPGHTPEGISILVYDTTSAGEKPHAVLTGDALFIGDVGRPDLMASVGISARELAGMLYDSTRDKLLRLDDDTLVYPAHGAGSMCGKNLSSETVSTIGIQRLHNYALQPMSRDQFVDMITAEQPEAPAYFSHDARLNRAVHPSLHENLAETLKVLPLDEFMHRAETGAVILDVREPADFAGAHLAGSLNIGLSGKYATWAGSLLDHQRPILLVAEPGREHEAALRLGRIGFDNVGGFLEGGMLAVEKHPELIGRMPRLTASTLGAKLEEADPPMVLDVRTEGEAAEKRIPGSVNIPLQQLRRRLEEIPRDRPLVVACASGYRSSIAASLLAAAGYSEVTDLVGGFAAWEASRGARPA